METENVPDRERKEQRLDVRAGLVAPCFPVDVVIRWLLVSGIGSSDLGEWSTFWSFVALPVFLRRLD